MSGYFDSSALVPIYVPEEFSARARREIRRDRHAPFTAVHDLEVRNALRLLCGRKLITAAELRGAIAHVEEDLEARRLVATPLDFFRVFERSVSLSAEHSTEILCRTLDILHIAAALELRATRFVSADDRQLALALATGLEAVDIKRRR